MSMGLGLKLGKLWRRKTWTGWEEEEEVVAGPVAVDTEAAMEARAMVMVEAMAARVAMVGVMAAMEAAMVMVVVIVAMVVGTVNKLEDTEEDTVAQVATDRAPMEVVMGSSKVDMVAATVGDP